MARVSVFTTSVNSASDLLKFFFSFPVTSLAAASSESDDAVSCAREKMSQLAL